MKHWKAIAIIAVAFAIGLVFSLNLFTKSADLSQVTATVIPPKALPAFSLVDHNKQAFTNQSLGGTWTLVFVGYTFCPDICPTALSDLQKVQTLADQAGIGEKLTVRFVSVDPKRDTPDRLKQYVTFFEPRFWGNTGSDAEIAKFARGIGAVYKVHDDGSENYLVDHSGGIVLINPQGQFRAYFSAPHDPVQMAKDLQIIIAHDS